MTRNSVLKSLKSSNGIYKVTNVVMYPWGETFQNLDKTEMTINEAGAMLSSLQFAAARDT